MFSSNTVVTFFSYISKSRGSVVDNTLDYQSWQGLTNPLPGRPGQAPNRAGLVLFPARRPAGQVKENFKQLKFGEIYSKCRYLRTQ